jgi:hypothetical protein
MRANNAIRVSLPRGSYESLPVLATKPSIVVGNRPLDLGDEDAWRSP